MYIFGGITTRIISIPLTVVSVGAPSINCVFDTTCSITVSDTVSAIPLPVSGNPFLQSRTFVGKPGTPAQGLYGYEYRVNLSQTVSSGSKICLNSLRIKFGRVVNTLNYDGVGSEDEVFVITGGALGSIGVSSADIDSYGNISFKFTSPVCSGTVAGPGDSTFFFGLASKQSTTTVSAVAMGVDKYKVNAIAPLNPPDLSSWLNSHPTIANAIRWQYKPADPGGNVYLPPTDFDTVAWPYWSQSQKSELNEVYIDTWEWFMNGASQVPMDPAGLTDEPYNLDGGSYDTTTVQQAVTPAYMWKLFLSHIAFSLVTEIMQQVPWSILSYDGQSLRYIFNSTTMAWYVSANDKFKMGTYSVFVPANRADNLPETSFAPPMWVYPFMKQSGLIGSTRLQTIGKVLDWMRHNMWHFYGTGSTFGDYYAAWQYRGYAPISKIVNGTVDAHYSGFGLQHWTPGCHGSVGFLHEVLRVVNIPVQPVWICGHELAYFLSEKLYLDHGDDPYNLNVTASSEPSLSLLIDEATYQSWFSYDLGINITDPQSSACGNVSRRAIEFPP